MKINLFLSFLLIIVCFVSCWINEKPASVLKNYEISDDPLYSLLEHYVNFRGDSQSLSKVNNFIVVQFDSVYLDTFYIQVFEIDSSLVGLLLKSDRGTIFGMTNYSDKDILLFGDENPYLNKKTKKKTYLKAIEIAEKRLLEAESIKGLIPLNFECDIYFFVMWENGHALEKVIFDSPHL